MLADIGRIETSRRPSGRADDDDAADAPLRYRSSWPHLHRRLRRACSTRRPVALDALGQELLPGDEIELALRDGTIVWGTVAMVEPDGLKLDRRTLRRDEIERLSVLELDEERAQLAAIGASLALIVLPIVAFALLRAMP